MSISPRQCRAARALAGIGCAELAEASGLPLSRLETFERGQADLSESDGRQLRTGLEKLGAVLIAEDEWGGAGVRLKFGAEQARRMGTWEAEGGTPGDDEVP